MDYETLLKNVKNSKLKLLLACLKKNVSLLKCHTANELTCHGMHSQWNGGKAEKKKKKQENFSFIDFF